MKAVLRGKFIALSAHMKKLENSHIRKLTSQLKTLEQKEMNSFWKGRQQEILKLRSEINKLETNKQKIPKNQWNIVGSSRKSTR